MNKQAVVLAADSAATSGGQQAGKIFPSANKIFMLSKAHPVGVMIYGEASFMEVPWDIIIKMYRTRLVDKGFDSLRDYTDDFIRFISEDKIIFPEEQRKRFYIDFIRGFFELLKTQIGERVKDIIKAKGEVDKNEISEVISAFVGEIYDTWHKAEFISPMHQRGLNDLAKKYAEDIGKIIEGVFERHEFKPEILDKLKAIPIYLAIKAPKDVPFPMVSGIVFSGFGLNDIFPKLISFLFVGNCDDFLVYRENVTAEINFNIGASVIPFAQSDMVFTFMEGVNPSYQKEIIHDLDLILNAYKGTVVSELDKTGIAEKQQYDFVKLLEEINGQLMSQYEGALREYRRKEFSNRVTDVVKILPKEEMAVMAETLINLTSFKRRMSFSEQETVGGPIDVAVISKGDGFIWIKRKHYFEPALNPHFIAGYYKEVKNGRESSDK